MRFPLTLTASLSSYIAGKRLRGVENFPLVMMLEPLHACNLTCTGCGRIREYKDTIQEKLTVQQCLNALDECGAPVVSICGGEPMIYPEIGMGPVAAQLAAQRLAPTQCNFAGHPETSGYPTLDYFLSSDLMEPPDGPQHYTERLVRLPNMATYYEPVLPPPEANEAAEFGWPSTVPIFWCGQSLFKYLPQHDAVFPRIAREVGCD